MLTFVHGEDLDSHVLGLSLVEGSCGILCDTESAPRIECCLIATNVGHGISCDDGSPMILCCIIENNGLDGINSASEMPLVIKNSWIHDNGDDGIEFSVVNSATTVRNNTITGNGGTDYGSCSGSTVSKQLHSVEQ